MSSRWWARSAGALTLVGLAIQVPGAFGSPVQQPWALLAALVACAMILVGPVPPNRSGLTRVAHALVLLSLITPVIAIAGKAVLVGAPPAGFAACYRILTEPTIADCERSFDAVVQRDITRYDAAIDFGPRRPVYGEWLPPGWATSSWALGAVNDGRYNFYSPGDPSRERMPFIVSWSGTVNASDDVTIRYVGQGELAVNGTATALPASYAEPAELTVPIPSTSGAQDGDPVALNLFYVWTPTVDDQNLPFAQVQLSSQGRILDGVSDARWVRPVTWLVDIALALSILLMLIWLIWRVGRSPVAWSFLAVAAGVSALLGTVGIPPPAYPVLVGGLLLAAAGMRWYLPRQQTNTVLALALPALAVSFMRSDTGEWSARLLLRLGGSDYLTYELLARSILTEASLRAGEDAFFYSPAMRYVVALQHGLLGDTDTYALAVGFAAMVAAAWFAIDRLLSVNTGAEPWSAGSWSLLPGGSTRQRTLALCAVVGGVALLGALVGTSQILTAWGAPYSEFWTWICLLVALPLALTARRVGGFVLASLLLGVMFTFRANQSVGIAAILVVAIVRVWSSGPATDRLLAARRVLIRVVAPFLAIALLPAVHNAVYAKRLLFLTDTVWIPVNYPLPVGDVVRLGSDPMVRETLMSQLAALTGFVQGTLVVVDGPFLIVVHVIQLAYVGTIAAVLLRRRVWPRNIAYLLLIPIAFALPHVFLQVWLYYPRHVVAIYISACLVILAIVGRAVGARTSR